MKEIEKKYISISIITSSLLFISGALFGYFFIFPYLLDFVLSYSNNSLIPVLSMNSYFKVFSRILLAFGIIFELPIIIVILSLLNIINYNKLLIFSKYAIVIIFIISALITPPDVVTQILMGLPLVLLYFISTLIVFIIEKLK